MSFNSRDRYHWFGLGAGLIIFAGVLGATLGWEAGDALVEQTRMSEFFGYPLRAFFAVSVGFFCISITRPLGRLVAGTEHHDENGKILFNDTNDPVF